MMAKYKKQKSSKVEVGMMSIACCDCGLVHLMGFTLEKDNKIRVDYVRNERATAQLRNGKLPDLKGKDNPSKWIMVRKDEAN